MLPTTLKDVSHFYIVYYSSFRHKWSKMWFEMLNYTVRWLGNISVNYLWHSHVQQHYRVNTSVFHTIVPQLVFPFKCIEILHNTSKNREPFVFKVKIRWFAVNVPTKWMPFLNSPHDLHRSWWRFFFSGNILNDFKSKGIRA